MASSSEEGRQGALKGDLTMERLSVTEYFTRPESLDPMELVYGVVREPPAPRYGHQSLVTHLGALLHVYVRGLDLGEVCVSPVDVVLDEAAALVVQPDGIFIAKDRLSIVRERVFGPPDLVVEVLSAGTATRDRTVKLEWYRRYGVRECWLVDHWRRSVEVVNLPAGEHRVFDGDSPLESVVLPGWTIQARQVFD